MRWPTFGEQVRLLGFLLAVVAVSGVIGWGLADLARGVVTALASSAPAAAPVPHIASDCRAACTLEGMELAGVELGLNDGARVETRCLCAPVSAGGDL